MKYDVSKSSNSVNTLARPFMYLLLKYQNQMAEVLVIVIFFNQMHNKRNIHIWVFVCSITISMLISVFKGGCSAANCFFFT